MVDESLNFDSIIDFSLILGLTFSFDFVLLVTDVGFRCDWSWLLEEKGVLMMVARSVFTPMFVDGF